MNAKVDVKQIAGAFKDIKTWLFSVTNTSVALMISSVGLFLPTFIDAFGYTPC